ncbi:hypothetical protein C8J56DRAFT_1164962 [Mycena floridula]|nr:hypothetical protein C8J56DRAFT_1164962 [Mycena floridula]
MLTMSRERRSWTSQEDQLLRDAVDREDPGNANPSKWHAIAKHVPNRTNKDCRKRWFAKMASDVVKGGWAPDEDERLVHAIEKYGTRWSLVATMVQSRNSDQCAKRWTDTLNPAIDRTTWTSEADATLIRAVNEHGKVWTKIVRTYFPGRTGLAAKNRYNSITRFNTESKPRKRAASPVHRKSESTSSSSSHSPCISTLSTPDFPGTYSLPPRSDGGDSPYDHSKWFAANTASSPKPPSFAHLMDSPGYTHSSLNTFSGMEGVTATSLSAFSDDLFSTSNYVSLPPILSSTRSPPYPYPAGSHGSHGSYQHPRSSGPVTPAPSYPVLPSISTSTEHWDGLSLNSDARHWDRYKNQSTSGSSSYF